MANFVFDVARGRVRSYADLPADDDLLILVPLSAAEIDADLRTRADLAQILAAPNNEQTDMGRKALEGVSETTDPLTGAVSITVEDGTYESPTGLPVAAWLICYVPDTSPMLDSATIPLVKLDGDFDPDGLDINFGFDGRFWQSA